MKPSIIFRAGLAAGTIGSLIAGSALFANIAAADTTGYQMGYTYHQGLATNAGANLIAQSGDTTGTTDTTADQTSTIDQSSINTSDTDTSATTPSSAAVDTTGAATLNTTADTDQAAAVEPAVTNTTDAATPSSVLTSQPFMMALWVLLGLAVLALVAMGISAIVNALSPNTDEDFYTERRVSYQS